MKYKNVTSNVIRFRAAKAADKLSEKAVYVVEPNGIIDVPVEISMGGMEIIDDTEKRTKKKGDEK